MPEKLTPDPKKGGRVYVPTATYDLKIKIDDLDYSADLIVVRFISSLSTAYQSVDLVFQLDTNDIILQQLYGKSSIILSIALLREDEQRGETIDLDLMYTKGKFKLNEKDQITEEKQKDYGYYTVSTVLRDPYKIMNTFVNDVFLGSDINSIINKLSSDVGASGVKFDSDGRNSEKIEQVCIPPTTLYKIIKEYNSKDINPFDGFLDQRFGLFDGIPGVFCQHDKTIHIKNLTAKMQKDPTFIIYQIATDMDIDVWELILDEVTKDNTFYTYTTVDTDYAGNAKFAKIGSKINHIVKPKDTLSHTITQDLKDIAGKYGIIYKNKNTDIDSAALRTRYMIQDTGDEKNETIFNSRTSRRVADLSTLTVDIERNLPVLNLIKVGECVKFKPKTAEYTDLEGKYILWSTDIWFRRENNWKTTAQVKLMRTNKRSGDTEKPKKDFSVLPENASKLRSFENTARSVTVGQSVVEAINTAGTIEPQQIPQSTNNIWKPYQGVPPEDRNEIKSNMERIVELTEKNRACEQAIGDHSFGCSNSDIKSREREIRRLRKKNLRISSQRIIQS